MKDGLPKSGAASPASPILAGLREARSLKSELHGLIGLWKRISDLGFVQASPLSCHSPEESSTLRLIYSANMAELFGKASFCKPGPRDAVEAHGGFVTASSRRLSSKMSKKPRGIEQRQTKSRCSVWRQRQWPRPRAQPWAHGKMLLGSVLFRDATPGESSDPVKKAGAYSASWCGSFCCLGQ